VSRPDAAGGGCKPAAPSRGAGSGSLRGVSGAREGVPDASRFSAFQQETPLGASAALVIAFAGMLLGTTIGATGIGGVLLVPVLTYGLGLPVKSAIALALWSYLWSGLLAVMLYARRGSIDGRSAAWLCLAAAPAAYLGARMAAAVPGSALEALIALLLSLSGLNALRRPAATGDASAPGGALLAALGAITGFGSAMVGAGGAVILVPLLVALDQPALLAIGLGQAIQLPIAAVASLSNIAAGLVDLALGSMLAAALALGIAVGTPLAHALPQAALRRLLGAMMLAAGLALAARLALSAA
jgi:uncharacterized membrane protein YfcA